MTGGPATALSFGKTFEALGVNGATTLGVSCAMFGMTAGGLLGGFIGGNIIRSRDLRSQTIGVERHAVLAPVADEVEVETEEASLLQNIIVIGICMGLGSLIGAWFTSHEIVLPEYVGAMIVAAIVRNLDDRFGFVRSFAAACGHDRQHRIVIVHCHGDAGACGSGNWRTWPCR